MSIIPDREDFSPNDHAVYRLVVPAMIKVRGAAEERSMPAGTIVEVDGWPAPWLEPMNSEAQYRKYCAIHIAARTPDWYVQAVLTAVSLGAPASSYEAAAKHVQDWMDRYPREMQGHA